MKILSSFFTLAAFLYSNHGTALAHSNDGAVATVDCSSYINSIQIEDILLEFVSTDTALSVRMTSSKKSFLSFGISATGRMAGGEAVIGTTPNDVKLYSLSSSIVTEIQDTSRQTLINATFVQDDDNGSVLEFTKLLDDGTANQKINGDGKNTFIWSQGNSNNLLNGHTALERGAVEITLKPCIPGINTKDDGHGNPVDIVGNNKNSMELFKIHGILAIISFAVFMPIAAAFAAAKNLFQSKLCNKKTWFVVHTLFITLAYIFAIAVFVLAVYAVNDKGGTHFHNAHEIWGLITFILFTVQVTWASFRPQNPSIQAETNDNNVIVSTDADTTGHSDTNADTTLTIDGFEKTVKAEKPPLRTAWEIMHRLIAFVILACAWYQMHSGLILYQEMYNSKNYVHIFWIMTGVLILCLVPLVVYSKTMRG